MWIFLPRKKLGTSLWVFEKVMFPTRFGPMRSCIQLSSLRSHQISPGTSVRIGTTTKSTRISACKMGFRWTNQSVIGSQPIYLESGEVFRGTRVGVRELVRRFRGLASPFPAHEPALSGPGGAKEISPGSLPRPRVTGPPQTPHPSGVPECPMPSTYLAPNVHLVFATADRAPLIDERHFE